MDGEPLKIRVPGPEVDGPLFAPALAEERCRIIKLVKQRHFIMRAKNDASQENKPD
jgi:hypothetical protein